MLTISYQTPDISAALERPVAFSNQSYPYNQLPNDRRFEELVYSLVKQQLGYGEFSNYDSISLMSGVSDLGRDCALFKNGNSDAVIQCKKYEKNLSKEDFGKEITKFILYSFIDNKILSNPKTFTYYIAVSKGFVRDCSDFIDSFQREIVSEPALSNWVSYNLNKYISLAPLKISLNETIQKMIGVLSKISVKKIIPPDLDRYLNYESSKHLNALFFEVRTVTDNTLIKELREDIIHAISQPINGAKLGSELDRGSISLKSETNEFTEIPDSHIEREETNALLNWINGDLKKDKFGRVLNVCLLAGNAGMGKTVILKDLYDKLAGTGVAVLGLKADKLASSSVKELQEKIGLSSPLYEFIEACKIEFKTTVLVIDQIDALSQSMSSDRSYLQVFKDLVDQYLYDQNVKIIISVRIFDLHYDPSLRLYKKIETISVKQLTEDQVLRQLTKLNIKKEVVTTKLLSLLKIPNQLNVFSRIYNSNQTSLGITTLQEMYQELWRQKILNLPRNGIVDKKLIKELLYKIADKMFSDQQITVSELLFEDYSQELSYLESEHLIKKEGHQLQFFHQSFYDFVFAKQFIEKGNDLNLYIKKHGQSLLLRSAVKMMLNYLREYNPLEHIKVLNNIFNDDKILFHIKHMTLSSILFYEQPTDSERKIIFAAISKSFHLCILFFEQGVSACWFEFAQKNKLLGILNSDTLEIIEIEDIDLRELPYLKNAAFFFLRHAANNNYPGAWEFTSNLTDQSYTRNILFVNNDWSSPLPYEIFEKCIDFEKVDPYGYYFIIERIAQVNADYALKQLAMHLENKPKNKNAERDYEERKVLKTLAKKIPNKLFHLLFNVVSKDLNKVETGRHFIGDYRYMQIDLQDKETLTGNDYLFRLLGVCLKRSATNYGPDFLNFFEQYKNSRLKPLLRLLIFAFRGNEEEFTTQIFELTMYLLAIDELYYDSTLGVENRIVFEKAFPYFSEVQQRNIIQQIKQIVHPHELFSLSRPDTEKAKIYSSWGKKKYSWIKRLPPASIEKDIELKKVYQELNRRFPDYIDKERTGIVAAGIVQAPLSEKAYKYMNQQQWLSSFKKYNGTIGHFDRHYLKGDVEEHSNAFKNIVKNDPSSEKLEIIKAALSDPEINPRYPIYGIWGWSESRSNLEAIIPLFKEITAISTDQTLKRLCLYIAKDLSGRETEDGSVVDFLVSCALDFEPEEIFELEDEEETSTNNLIMKGINTANGSAASALVHIKDENFKDLVFNTLDTVFRAGPAHSKAASLFQFAYLMNADKECAFKLFKNALINEHDVHILASSIWSLQYMGNYDFEQLHPVYDRLVSSNFLGSEDSRWLFTILYGSFLYDKPGAKELLHKLIVNNKYVSSSAVNEIMQEYYTVEGSKDKNDQLLNFLIDKATEEDFDDLSWNFGVSSHLKLADIKPFLNRYLASSYFKMNDAFIEYLTFQCNQYAPDAIELFDLALTSNKFGTSDRIGIHSSESGTKFIVSAFNSLIKNDQESESLKMKLMIAFDNVLKDHRFKADTDHVLEELS